MITQAMALRRMRAYGAVATLARNGTLRVFGTLRLTALCLWGDMCSDCDLAMDGHLLPLRSACSCEAKSPLKLRAAWRR